MTPTVQALRLRAWAWRLISERGVAPPPDASPDAWRVFLFVERCATLLMGRLERNAAVDELSADAEAALRAARETELRRMLSARAQLATLGRLAGERGWRAVVLKGGVPLGSGGEALDLGDVDVLLPRDQAIALGAALDERGFAAAGGDVLDQPGVWHHLAQRRAPDEIQVEVHFDVPEADPAAILRGAVPLRPGSALLRPPPALHLQHLLTHAVATHAYRRGNLRDVLLIATALPECTAAEVAAVRAGAQADPRRDAFMAMLEMARAVGGGVPAPDPFAAIAAGNYLLNERPMVRRLPPALGQGVSEALFRALGGEGDRIAHRQARAQYRSDSLLGWVAWAERRLGPVGRALHGASRHARIALSEVLARPYAARARQAVVAAAEHGAGEIRPDAPNPRISATGSDGR